MIINLTSSTPTPEQVIAGVEDLPSPARDRLLHLLNFKIQPSNAQVESDSGLIYGEVHIADLEAVSHEIATIASSLGGDDHDVVPLYALIDGPGWFTRKLEDALMEVGIVPTYFYTCAEGNGFVVSTALD